MCKQYKVIMVEANNRLHSLGVSQEGLGLGGALDGVRRDPATMRDFLGTWDERTNDRSVGCLIFSCATLRE